MNEVKRFRDRSHAAEELVRELQYLKGTSPLVLGVPRGAVPMAKRIAVELSGEVDLVLVKKIGHPMHEEFAIAAVSEEGDVVFGRGAHSPGVTEGYIESEALRLTKLLREKRKSYTGSTRKPDPKGRDVIIVDDGIATGATMVAAVRMLHKLGARTITVAAPVASGEAVRLLEAEGADVRVSSVSENFGAVSLYYDEFTQVSDAEVGEQFSATREEITVKNTGFSLEAVVSYPRHPLGVVIFAHGSGSGRFSPRNRYVADILNRGGIATVLADLLTNQEAQDREKVFDIDLLAKRLLGLVRWAKTDERLKELPVAFFGASTGGGAALRAAAEANEPIVGVISRGGRPDLAGAHLTQVKCPVLLIVGGKDQRVLELNQNAMKLIPAVGKKIEVIPGATHLFEEPGALEQVALLSSDWLQTQFDDLATEGASDLKRKKGKLMPVDGSRH